jgi:hypothetical protein
LPHRRHGEREEQEADGELAGAVLEGLDRLAAEVVRQEVDARQSCHAR